MRRGRIFWTLVAMVLWSGGVVGASSVDWARVDPTLAEATFVNDDTTCADCHDDYIAAYSRTRHARAFQQGSRGGCESCHGPRSLHIEDPEASGTPWNQLSTTSQSAVCQQCHQSGSRLHWNATAHASAEVSCSSCHLVMERTSERGLLIKEDANATCYSCHAEVRGEMARMSHHPLEEGSMTCASCHDVHGSTQPAMMRGNTVNDACYSCHAEKRGPFVWEHAPARESCLNCHAPHGSNQRNMLTQKDPFLCLTCHSYGGHINLPRYNRTSNPYGSGCVNCHITAHGSNHPSGAKLTR